MSKKKEEDEENQTFAHYKKFIGQGPAYFGDVDEADGNLLESEREAEEAGKFYAYPLTEFSFSIKIGKRHIYISELRLAFP